MVFWWFISSYLEVMILLLNTVKHAVISFLLDFDVYNFE